MKSKSTDPRSQRTRQLLREALMTIVVDKPFRDLTIRDITDAAGVNRATFYLHYEDKYDLLEDCAEEIFETIRTMVKMEEFFDVTHLQISPEDELQRMTTVLKIVASKADFFRAMMRQDGTTMFQTLFRETASNMMKSQVIALFEFHEKSVDEDLIDMMVRFQSAGNFDVIGWWLENDMQIPIEVMAKRLATITMPPLIRLLINESIHID